MKAQGRHLNGDSVPARCYFVLRNAGQSPLSPLGQTNWPCPASMPIDLTHPGNGITVITDHNVLRILFHWHPAPFFLIGVLTWFLFRCDRVWNGLIPGGRESRSDPYCGSVFMVNVLWELQTMTVDGLASSDALLPYSCVDFPDACKSGDQQQNKLRNEQEVSHAICLFENAADEIKETWKSTRRKAAQTWRERSEYCSSKLVLYWFKRELQKR